jgi:hypothetical protein
LIPSAQTAVPLLASLVHPAPEDFFDALVGRLQRLLHEERVPGLSSDAVGQVLRALLQHDGWHSNRVWAGVPRLSQVAGVGERTVRRVLRWLRSLGIVREVTGEELYRGPGPHQWPTERRRGKLETTCYDLSGLVPLIPAAFRKAGSVLWAEKAENAEAAGAASLLPGESQTPPLLPPLPDPFADPGEASSPAFSVSKGTKQAALCPVYRKDAEQAGNEKRPSPPARPSPFTGPNLAAIRRGEKGEQGRPEHAKEASPRIAPGDEATAFRGLRGQKVSPTVARGMLASRGARWCLTLLAYGRWMRRRKSVGPGWYVAVWQHWQAEDGTWPDDFLTWHAKEKAHAARVVRRAGEARPGAAPHHAMPVALRRPTRPVLPPAPPAPPAAVDVKALLAGLTGSARVALEERARAELQAEMGRAPVPPVVRSRMLVLLAKESERPPVECITSTSA